ncbi:hypothetical protein BZB76_0013 [Actinomadura pelletieri DSM 43383]|uniref:Uncharacterized protein n=1 Tax=Actinomadura pelletieri DSM 43383 TaxID=1120940 RepID=A0A495QXF0_9ACTN|nr:hypothetical protein [Actinomadura pelletieri]RKS78596.1 hypothetical protein BZB76_0013 [Actinomadura pelletieri DSM 43383]
MQVGDGVTRKPGHRVAERARNHGKVVRIEQRTLFGLSSRWTTIRTDDGVEVPHTPDELLRLWERADRWIPDALSWWPDIPESTPYRRIRVIDVAEVHGYRYQLQGSAGRWFIVRDLLEPKPNTPRLRTKFFPNQQIAQEVFTHLTTV